MPRLQRLLIVEDDPNLRRLYQEEFEDEGYEVLVCESGEKAIDLARLGAFDGAVIDICLGGMDGIEVMRNLLAERPDLAVVLNSAYTSFKSDFSTWAAESYVVKSSDMGGLKTAVREALGTRRAA